MTCCSDLVLVSVTARGFVCHIKASLSGLQLTGAFNLQSFVPSSENLSLTAVSANLCRLHWNFWWAPPLTPDLVGFVPSCHSGVIVIAVKCRKWKFAVIVKILVTLAALVRLGEDFSAGVVACPVWTGLERRQDDTNRSCNCCFIHSRDTPTLTTENYILTMLTIFEVQAFKTKDKVGRMATTQLKWRQNMCCVKWNEKI